ncbi:MAG: Mu-like prophage major head subunit gpT family protein [Magnetococcales bacterium]|nr:Mu-like prophage major head subunit gpT family protein [Magnetococcales bacterium]
MIVNTASLVTLTTAFSAMFNKGLRDAKPQWQSIATMVQSSSASQEYGILGHFAQIEEWIDERHTVAMKQHGYTIRNKMFAGTVEVRRTDIEDDQYGIYSPLMEELGRASAIHPDKLVFGLLKDGTSGKCYDGLPFFSASHPTGKTTASNLTTGAKPMWFLMDTSRALKPMIYQRRKDYQLVVKNQETDDSVFDRGVYKYGVDGRCNVGYGFWQMAHACSDTLDKDAVNEIRTAMQSLKNDTGDPLYIQPDTIVVGPSNQAAAEELFLANYNAAGATNILYKAMTILVSPMLE